MLDDQTAIVDPLSYGLASLSWSTWRAGVFKGHAPWGVRVADGHAALYAVRHGEAWLGLSDSDEPVRLGAGEVVMIPRGTAHALHDARKAQVVHDVARFTRNAEQSSLNGNGQANATMIVYGYSLAYGSGSNPLHANLPTLIRLGQDALTKLHDLEGLFAMVEAEQRRREPGWQVVVNQLLQAIFYQVMRAFIAHEDMDHPEDHDPGCEAGRSSVVSDPAIGLVVGLLHSQPGDSWTVASLARWVNMSRSAFSERFREVVGQPPLHYLTELRMSRACQMLVRTDLGVKQIATLVGYESPSSFTNAFKRRNGVSPAAYRAYTTEPAETLREA